MKKLLGIMAATIFAATLVGCEDKGPAEQAGESIDNAASDIRDGASDAGDSISDAASDAGDSISDSMSDIGDSASDAMDDAGDDQPGSTSQQ